jgi:tetratricopeptide (TPR) repeat protein
VALLWAEERCAAELGLRLASFCRLWHVGGQIDEAVHWLEQTLALDAQARARGEPAAPVTLRVERLYGFARVLLGGGQLERAAACATEALEMARQTGDEAGMSEAHATLGLIAQAGGANVAAALAFAASYAHAKAAGNSDLICHALVQQAEVARLRGDLDRAAMLLSEALATLRESENTWDTAVVTTLLGHLAYQQRRYAQARAHYRASLTLFRVFATPHFTAWCLEGLAAALCAEGHTMRAARLCAAAAALRAHAHAPLPPAERDAFERTVARANASLGETAFRSAWIAGSAFTQDVAITEALAEGAERRESSPLPQTGRVRRMPM